MSRIHEALLRAEQEKGAGVAPQPGFVPGFEGEREPELSGASSEPGTVSSTVAEQFFARVPQREWQVDKERLLFFDPQRHTVALEGFRLLRSKLYKEQTRRHVKTLLVTSSAPSEGKTFIASNLALAFAQQIGKRVLLIDADLRRPTIHKSFGIPADPGLAEYLRGDVDEFAVIQQGQHGMCVIPSGQHPPNPAELLNSDRMRTLLAKAAEVFDWIVLDSPPAAGLADPMVLAEICDGILLVVGEGTPLKVAQRLTKDLRERPLLGTVFNRSKTQKDYAYYYSSKAEEKEAAAEVKAENSEAVEDGDSKKKKKKKEKEK